MGRVLPLVELPELRLWASKREVRRAAFARRFPIGFLGQAPMDFHSGGLGRSKKPRIH